MNVHINWAVVALAFIGIAIAYSFFKAHRDPTFVQFNVFDLIIHQGRLDKIAVVFMAVFIVTTWIMVDLQISGKMTEGYLTAYGTMWVVPLTAKVVFGANSSQGMAVPGQTQQPYGQPFQTAYQPTYTKPYTAPYPAYGDPPPPGYDMNGNRVAEQPGQPPQNGATS